MTERYKVRKRHKTWVILDRDNPGLVVARYALKNEENARTHAASLNHAGSK